MAKSKITSHFDDQVGKLSGKAPSNAFITPGDSNLPLVIGYDQVGNSTNKPRADGMEFLYAKKG